ncbi:CLD18 protein, partial [Polypterus senegalus]
MCQIAGFFVSFLGAVAIIAATVMNSWSTQDLENDPVAAVYNTKGLWQTCETGSSGYTECRPYMTILGLPGFLGIAGIIASTAMDQWKVQDLYDNPVTSVVSSMGLWRSCVTESSGFTDCRPFFTIMGLPALVQACRALMIVGIVLATIGILVSIFALKCIKIGNMEDKAKANLTLTSGIMFAVAGVCAIAGVSVYANSIVNNFVIQTVSINMGSLQTRYNAVSYKAPTHNTIYKSGGTYNENDYKKNMASSDAGRQSNPAKFDYV